MLLSVKVSWLEQHHHISISWKSKLANQKKGRLFVDTCSQFQDCNASKSWQSVFSLAKDVPDISTKLQEASWRHCEVVFGANLTVYSYTQSHQQSCGLDIAFDTKKLMHCLLTCTLTVKPVLNTTLRSLHKASRRFAEHLLLGQTHFTNTSKLHTFRPAKECSGTHFNASD